MWVLIRHGVGSVERTGWRAHATDASPALPGQYLDTARACRGRGAFTRRVWRERLLVAAVRYMYGTVALLSAGAPDARRCWGSLERF